MADGTVDKCKQGSPMLQCYTYLLYHFLNGVKKLVIQKNRCNLDIMTFVIISGSEEAVNAEN